MSQYPLLASIDRPAQLRQLSEDQLGQVADELRAFLLDSVSRTGGHLSSNLGTVELSIALHYVFDTPDDRIVWDVGHQTYGHKVLTGRRELMSSLRQWEGISGFPRRCESEYDVFGTAHSSTSISAALGLAVAARDTGSARRSIAVIGDGAMSGGMAFEAMNHGGDVDGVNLLVILNDNEMSISPPVGALTRILARLMSGRTYNAARRAGERVLGVSPPVREFARRVEEHFKGLVTPGTLFEEFGFHYYGPIDGHDLDTLVPTLQNLRELDGLHFLHVITRKGQGYKRAESDPVLYHGVSRFDHQEGIKQSTPPEKPAASPTYTEVFGQWLCDAAEADERVVGITPAMREGSGLVTFAERYPSRYHDVGIAEQHALTFAAGLACEGRKPVVAIYSTFLQRGYDQLIHDIALQNLPVTFAIDRAGLVGADGATHHGAFDLSYLQCIPNLVVMAPADERECRQMLQTALMHDGPAAVRYPRGKGPGVLPLDDLSVLPIGRSQPLRHGREVALLAFGSMVGVARDVGERIDATVVNMRFVKPLDEACIRAMARDHRLIVTLEENACAGGVGGEVSRVLDLVDQRPKLLRIGLPDHFIDHGDARILLQSAGLDVESILARIAAVSGVGTPVDERSTASA